MNDVTFTKCELSAEMVPYMYGELPAAKTALFESHLPECSACTDEFASLSLARYEVYDWKKLEFDGLATPAFAIPFESGASSLRPTFAEKVRAVFELSWTVPGVAFAAVAVVSMFAAFFVLSENGDREVVANLDRPNSAAADRTFEPLPQASVPQSQAASGARPAPAQQKLTSVRLPASKSVPRRAGVQSVKAASRSYEFTQASARNENKKVPRLNEFAEDEDTSLRLAELFDDLDSRN